MITFKNIRKSYHSQGKATDVIALDDVSLSIPSGELIGVLGPNGAGKTTLLNILATILVPDSGLVEIMGLALVPRNVNRIRSLMNMSSGFPNFPWSLTVTENLRFYGRLYGLTGRTLSLRIEQVIALFSLGDFAYRRFDELSSGTKQRLSLAKSLLNQPRVLLLDEPTVGLDPDVSITIRDTILRLWKERGITIILTTHNMKEAEEMCQRIAFIKQGRILKVATPAELKSSQRKQNLEEVFVALARGSGTTQRTAIETISLPKSPQTVTTAYPAEPFLESIRLWCIRSMAFSYRNYLFAVRNFFAFAELIFWPSVTLISIGLMGDFLNINKNALAFIITGALAGGVLQVAQLDVAYSILYDIWSKSLKHTLMAPVSVSSIGFGSWINGIVRGSAIFAILALAAWLLFGFSFPGIKMTLIFLWGIFSCSLLMGLLVTLLILRFGQKAEISAWMFAYLFMLICGIYYPVETLPLFWQILARLMPLTYFLEYFRTGFGFAASASHLLEKGFGLVGLYLALELIAIRAGLDAARRNGIIVRLSE